MESRDSQPIERSCEFSQTTKLNRYYILVICILSIIFHSNGQTAGDFRSSTSGNWATASNWETFNGIGWATSSTYPGQNPGSYQVTILAGDTISIPSSGITTNPMGPLTINGTLMLNGDIGSDINFGINTPQIYITPGLTPYASITFINKSRLLLPSDAILRVWTAGLQGECNNHQEIHIGSNTYAVCNGAPGDIFTFTELMAGGGTINAIITPSTTNICLGSTVNLASNYTGAIITLPTYKWSNTGPQKLIFTPDSTAQNTTITPTLEGTCTINLTVSTINDGTSYSNTERIILTVNKKSSNPTAATPGTDSLMLGKSTTLSLIGGGGGGNETIAWYTSSCGGTLIGTGNNLIVSPTVETTYYGRYEDGTPCNYNTACAQATITIIPFANIWKGTVSTDFGTSSNWLDNIVPRSGENLTFDNNPINDCILDSNRIIGDLNNPSSKNLSASSHNLTINGTTKITGSGKITANTSGSITYEGSALQTLTPSHFSENTIQNLIITNSKNVNLSGDLTISNSLTLSNGTFFINSNTLTLNDSLKITNGQLTGGSSSNMAITGNGANLILPSITLKNLILNRTNGLTLGGSIQIHRTLTLTNGTLSIGPNKITFSGTSPTVSSGSIDATHSNSEVIFTNELPITLPNKLFSGSINSIALNNAGGITMSENLSISKNIALNQGKIHTGSNTLIIENAANNISGGNANSFIDGFCKKIGNTAFTFTIGHSNSYAPIGISEAKDGGNPADSFTASYYGTNPHPTYDSTQHESSIAQISEMEYWLLNREGSNNVSVTLSWGARSGSVSLLSDLLVARWDGSTWINEGNASTTGDIYSGTITSELITDFSPFTLGSLRAFTNILPVTLSDFKVKCIENSPFISWSTSSELNNNYFVIEHSTDANIWNPIHQTQGAGNSSSERKYSYYAQFCSNSDYFYRIKCVDFDGKSHYSPILFLESCGLIDELKIYPIPSKGVVYLKFSGDIEKITSIEIHNLTGEKTFSHRGFIESIDFSDQPKGTYYIVVFYGNKRIIEKFTITN